MHLEQPGDLQPSRAGGLGKPWTTSVPSLISRLIYSSELVDWTFVNVGREVRERGQVFLRIQEHGPDLGKLLAEDVGDGVYVGAHEIGGGRVKTVRIAAAIVSRDSLSITPKMLRRR